MKTRVVLLPQEIEARRVSSLNLLMPRDMAHVSFVCALPSCIMGGQSEVLAIYNDINLDLLVYVLI